MKQFFWANLNSFLPNHLKMLGSIFKHHVTQTYDWEIRIIQIYLLCKEVCQVINSQWSKVLIHGRNIYFGCVWENSSKYSVSQKSFSKLTTITPRKTQDNFKINIQKNTLIRKSWALLFSNQKENNGVRL